MKLLTVLFITCFFITTSQAQLQVKSKTADKNIIRIKMEKRWDNQPQRLQSLSYFDKENIWSKAYPALLNVPIGYDSVSQLSHYIDYDQVVFQAYKRGDMPFSFLQQVITKWGVDTVKSTPKSITSYVRAATGKKGNDWFYFLDEDGNGDLSNNQPVKFETKGNKITGTKEHMVKFERNINKVVGWDSTRIKVVSAKKENSGHLEIAFKYLENRVGTFKFNRKNHDVKLNAEFNSFNYLSDVSITINGNTGPYKKGDFFFLDGQMFFINDVMADGSEIIFTKMAAKGNYTSLQKGFLAPIFTGQTLNSEEIHLKDYRGSYTLVYFWNSTCGASTMRLEQNINPMLSELRNSKTSLKVLGVALDFPEKVKEFIQSKKINWPQLVETANGNIRGLYNINHFPTIYLIDPDGKIAENGLEFLSEDGLKKTILKYLKSGID